MTGMLDVLGRCRKSSGVRRNCKGGGRFTNRCDDAVALCYCGVSSCAMLGAREVPKMNTIERFVVAGFVAPRLRSGTFPRVIGVVDANGVVVRKITGEDLGRELLKRAEIECSSPVPPTVCPKCGGKKVNVSAKTCLSCSPCAPRPNVCPGCGGKKERPRNATCRGCRPRSQRPKGTCGKCGKTSFMSKWTLCQACAGIRKRERQTCACGSPKSVESETCKPCSLKRITTRLCRCGCGERVAVTGTACAKCHRAEVDAMVRAKSVCACGASKSTRYRMCAKCGNAARRTRARNCERCGAEKTGYGKNCRPCYFASKRELASGASAAQKPA